MISARSRARTRRYLLIGLMLSLMVHLLGGSLYGLISRAVVKAFPQWASLQTPPMPKSDIIRLERAQPTAAPKPVAIAKPKPRPPPPPPPVEHVQPQPVPAPIIHHHEIAHVVVHAPRQSAPSLGEGVAEPVPQRPAAGPRSRKEPYFSQDQLAQMNGAFEKTITSAHQTLAQANAAMDTAPVMTTKHVQMQITGIHEGMNPGDGIITVIGKPQHIGNVTYYYTHYEYMYGDGHVEEDDIPWPFHYGPGERDYFANPTSDHRVPLQPPPADYKVTRPLKPVLLQFFGGPEVH